MLLIDIIIPVTNINHKPEMNEHSRFCVWYWEPLLTSRAQYLKIIGTIITSNINETRMKNSRRLDLCNEISILLDQVFELFFCPFKYLNIFYILIIWVICLGKHSISLWMVLGHFSNTFFPFEFRVPICRGEADVKFRIVLGILSETN